MDELQEIRRRLSALEAQVSELRADRRQADGGMRGAVHEDHRSGLRFTVPHGWVFVEEPAAPFTTAAVPLDRQDTAGCREDGHDAAEHFITRWDDHRTVCAGRWENLPEDPDEERLLESAHWLATWFLDSMEWFVPENIHGVDHTERTATAASRYPAATVSFKFSADETGETAAYLRLVLIRLAEGRISFILGLGQSDHDQRLIDDCLDSAGPVTARPPTTQE